MLTVNFIDGMTVVELETQGRKSNTGIVGIHKRKSDGKYCVQIGTKTLGWCKQLDEAVRLRETGLLHKSDGTFDAWFATLRKNKKAEA